MTFVDFCKHFSNLSICHRVNTSLFSLQKRWYDSMFDGAWVKPHRAGGCANNGDSFFNNPQVLPMSPIPIWPIMCLVGR